MMAIDYASYERLLEYRIPEIQQTLTMRDTMLYALGVGLGADPVDERQLRFVYERNLLGADDGGRVPRPILHGLCTLGVAGHALLKTCCDYDPARLKSTDVIGGHVDCMFISAPGRSPKSEAVKRGRLPWRA
jgi:hypothetical protein